MKDPDSPIISSPDVRRASMAEISNNHTPIRTPDSMMSHPLYVNITSDTPIQLSPTDINCHQQSVFAVSTHEKQVTYPNDMTNYIDYPWCKSTHNPDIYYTDNGQSQHTGITSCFTNVPHYNDTPIDISQSSHINEHVTTSAYTNQDTRDTNAFTDGYLTNQRTHYTNDDVTGCHLLNEEPRDLADALTSFLTGYFADQQNTNVQKDTYREINDITHL